MCGGLPASVKLFIGTLQRPDLMRVDFFPGQEAERGQTSGFYPVMWTLVLFCQVSFVWPSETCRYRLTFVKTIDE